MNKFNLPTLKKQSGVILVLALVILLVLTLLIVSSMNITNNQVLMTGNTQYQTQALSDAESTLRVAEQSIDQFSVSSTARPNPGFIDVKSNPLAALDFSSFNWSPSTAATHSIGSRNSLYVIEFIDEAAVSDGTSIEFNPNSLEGDVEYVYRITARSTSARGARGIVQSIYITSDKPQ